MLNFLKNRNSLNKPDERPYRTSKLYMGGTKKMVEKRRTPISELNQKKNGFKSLSNSEIKFDLKNIQNIKPGEAVQDIRNNIIESYLKIVNKIRYWFLRTWSTFLKFILKPKTQRVIIASFLVISLSLFFYYSIFSTYFLVKNYKLKFAPGSYVDKDSMSVILKQFSRESLWGFSPVNHFWFMNDDSLTSSARSINPTIINVKVVDKVWPNTVELLIETKPILATLKINDQFYLISQNGTVIGLDEGGLKQKVVEIVAFQKNFSIEELSKILSENRNVNSSDFQNSQLNRLFFIDKIIPELSLRGLDVVKTELLTLYDKDNDIYFYTRNNTKLIFDSQNISIQNNLKRLDVLLETTKIGQEIREGKVSYIDLRIKGIVYTCYRGTECEK